MKRVDGEKRRVRGASLGQMKGERRDVIDGPRRKEGWAWQGIGKERPGDVQLLPRIPPSLVRAFPP
jgi:hypothetical protein